MTTKEEWWQFHKNNPIVWKYFVEFTLKALNAGNKKISHWLIINRIRWEIDIETKGDKFKINNNYIAYYARLFHHYYPQHGEVFSIRELKN